MPVEACTDGSRHPVQQSGADALQGAHPRAQGPGLLRQLGDQPGEQEKDADSCQTVENRIMHRIGNAPSHLSGDADDAECAAQD